MRFIDKLSTLSQGNQYSIGFLDVSYNDHDNVFIPRLSGSSESYEAFKSWLKSTKKYSEFIEYLLTEQYGRCCYCMGRLHERDVTLEHVVPQSLSNAADIDQYRQYSKHSPAIQRGVKHGPIFELQYLQHRIGLKKLRRMPHYVAYANLTASCRGILASGDGTSCCCNNYRSNYKILPLMLMGDVENCLRYAPSGAAVIIGLGTPEEQRQTMIRLNLNHATLKEVRHLWYLISCHYGDTQYVFSINTPNERLMFLRQLLGMEWSGDTPDSNAYFKYADSEFYWSVFLKYDWFFDYYKSNYPKK